MRKIKALWIILMSMTPFSVTPIIDSICKQIRLLGKRGTDVYSISVRINKGTGHVTIEVSDQKVWSGPGELLTEELYRLDPISLICRHYSNLAQAIQEHNENMHAERAFSPSNENVGDSLRELFRAMSSPGIPK